MSSSCFLRLLRAHLLMFYVALISCCGLNGYWSLGNAFVLSLVVCSTRGLVLCTCDGMYAVVCWPDLLSWCCDVGGLLDGGVQDKGEEAIRHRQRPGRAWPGGEGTVHSSFIPILILQLYTGYNNMIDYKRTNIKKGITTNSCYNK